MEIIPQIFTEFSNQVPNAGLLLLFPIVAVVMSFMTTVGTTVAAIMDAREAETEREKFMDSMMEKAENAKAEAGVKKLLAQGSKEEK